MPQQLKPHPPDGSRLTFIERVYTANRKTYGRYLCSCGNTAVIRTDVVYRGLSRSCGCLAKEVALLRGMRLRLGILKPALKHGHCVGGDSRTYTTWRAMKDRCTQPSHGDWPDYGGRGIAVCDRWRSSFENFLADMGERPEGMTIDRLDVNGNYEPGNCRWANTKQQRANQRGSYGSGG